MLPRRSLTAVFCIAACSVTHAAATAQQTKPLAYIRSVAVLPVRAAYIEPPGTVRPEPVMLGAKPNKKAQEELRVQRDSVRAAAPQTVQAELPGALIRTGGVSAVRQSARDDDLAQAAKDTASDAALSITIDRCGLHAGLERAVWIRVAGRMVTAGGEERGPFYGVGWARATRKLIGKGYSSTDPELVAQAARQAVTQMARVMRTGERAPFSGGGRVLVARASVPEEVQKVRSRTAGESSTVSVAVPALSRQSDVLFQPELPPIVEMLDPEETGVGARTRGSGAGGLWGDDGAPDRNALRRLAARSTADYIFVSRVRDVAAEEDDTEVPDGKERRPGIERKVDVTVYGALYSAAEDRIIWQDTVEGGTIARTEYVRHKPRIRTDEQAVMDAAHTAYAYLRYSFDEFRRRYYR